MRFETLDEAQAYLDRWDARWADTRIHGTTKRQVAAMFAEEQPALQPLPLEPFRYYGFGVRTVHLDGCVEIDAAYYSAPPGWIGRRVSVQWNDLHIRLLDPTTGQLLREHLRAPRGWHRIDDVDRPRRTPAKTLAALSAAHHAGASIGAVCDHIHQHEGVGGIRRILGVLALAKNHGPAVVDDAAKAALDLGAPTYRFIRRYLERRPPVRSHCARSTRSFGNSRFTAISSIAEQEIRNKPHRTRSRPAPAAALGHGCRPGNPVAPGASGEDDAHRPCLRTRHRRTAPATRPPPRATPQAGARSRSRSLPGQFRFRFQQEDESRAHLRARTARFIAQREDGLFLGPPGTGKSHLAQAIGRAAIQQGYRVIYREAHTLLEELTDATLAGMRKDYLTELATVPLLIIDDLGMRKLAHTAAEDLLELIMRRYERASTLLISNRPVDDGASCSAIPPPSPHC